MSRLGSRCTRRPTARGTPRAWRNPPGQPASLGCTSRCGRPTRGRAHALGFTRPSTSACRVCRTPGPASSTHYSYGLRLRPWPPHRATASWCTFVPTGGGGHGESFPATPRVLGPGGRTGRSPGFGLLSYPGSRCGHRRDFGAPRRRTRGEAGRRRQGTIAVSRRSHLPANGPAAQRAWRESRGTDRIGMCALNYAGPVSPRTCCRNSPTTRVGPWEIVLLVPEAYSFERSATRFHRRQDAAASRTPRGIFQLYSQHAPR